MTRKTFLGSAKKKTLMILESKNYIEFKSPLILIISFIQQKNQNFLSLI